MSGQPGKLECAYEHRDSDSADADSESIQVWATLVSIFLKLSGDVHDAGPRGTSAKRFLIFPKFLFNLLEGNID